MKQRLLFAFLAWTALLPGLAGAESDAALLHQPIKAAKLPAPGAPLPLKVQLAKSRSTGLRVRAFVELDGKLMDLPISTVETDESDNAAYTAEVNSPLASISYQFVATRQ